LTGFRYECVVSRECSAPSRRGRVFDSIVDAIGDTPIGPFAQIAAAARVHATFSPSWNILTPREREGPHRAAMIHRDGKAGVIHADTVLMSDIGNTGIALAFVAASRGYR